MVQAIDEREMERLDFVDFVKELDPISQRALKPFAKYISNNDIKEIVINKPGEVGLELPDGSWKFIEDPEMTLNQLQDVARVLANLAGQIFTPHEPLLSCKMPGGHRVQVVAGFATPNEFSMTIRLQRDRTFTIDDFQLTEEDKKTIIECVKTQKTLLISGGTGSGKTSFLNAIIKYIPEDERLISMEDVPELKIPHKNWVPLIFSANKTGIGQLDINDLMNACLRMRPDRIILGEIRKENAFTFCSAINTGHEGSMATIHANNPKMAMDAVLNRVLLNGDMQESVIQALRRQLIDDIYGVVQLNRVKGKGNVAYYTRLKGEEDLLEVNPNENPEAHQ